MHYSSNEKIDKPACGKSRRAGSFNTGNSLVIGLTGGIATGKSTAAGIFHDLGAAIISADELVHQLIANGSQEFERILEEFGNDILTPNREIDRKKLGKAVFDDPQKRKRLEKIIHPHVIKLMTEYSDNFRRECTGILVLELPLLFETSAVNIVDKVLVVAAEQETQIRRLYNRYGLSRKDTLLRINSQLPISEKIKQADWIVNNNGSVEDMRVQIEKVWAEAQKSLAHE